MGKKKKAVRAWQKRHPNRCPRCGKKGELYPSKYDERIVLCNECSALERAHLSLRKDILSDRASDDLIRELIADIESDYLKKEEKKFWRWKRWIASEEEYYGF
ncbi:hypothetical protein [Adlercreutzia caecimuris]|uniref:hypothetical protein n=1 Tax=Adlercreutzia caecimuris TaxID=671266 RepID=UPI001C3D7217|nr:hypothetical protein [Adlercreutzia caecimuris]